MVAMQELPQRAQRSAVRTIDDSSGQRIPDLAITAVASGSLNHNIYLFFLSTALSPSLSDLSLFFRKQNSRTNGSSDSGINVSRLPDQNTSSGAVLMGALANIATQALLAKFKLNQTFYGHTILTTPLQPLKCHSFCVVYVNYTLLPPIKVQQ